MTSVTRQAVIMWGRDTAPGRTRRPPGPGLTGGSLTAVSQLCDRRWAVRGGCRVSRRWPLLVDSAHLGVGARPEIEGADGDGEERGGAAQRPSSRKHGKCARRR